MCHVDSCHRMILPWAPFQKESYNKIVDIAELNSSNIELRLRFVVRFFLKQVPGNVGHVIKVWVGSGGENAFSKYRIPPNYHPCPHNPPPDFLLYFYLLSPT